MNATNQLELETILDASTLQDVLRTLTNICDEKAEHLASNWQDTDTARDWTRAARLVERCSLSPHVVQVSV
jgi:hypothetical protein